MSGQKRTGADRNGHVSGQKRIGERTGAHRSEEERAGERTGERNSSRARRAEQTVGETCSVGIAVTWCSAQLPQPAGPPSSVVTRWDRIFRLYYLHLLTRWDRICRLHDTTELGSYFPIVLYLLTRCDRRSYLPIVLYLLTRWDRICRLHYTHALGSYFHIILYSTHAL